LGGSEEPSLYPVQVEETPEVSGAPSGVVICRHISPDTKNQSFSLTTGPPTLTAKSLNLNSSLRPSGSLLEVHDVGW
jgi:hypothetical protein